MDFYKIFLLLVVSFPRSAQGEGCYPPPCAHGQFFCTHSGTDCCNLDSEFCSPETKECERALYDVAEGEEITSCCTFLTEEKGEDAHYERGSFKEGKLQVCKYLLGALTWGTICANLDKGTTAQPEQTSEGSESDVHGNSGNLDIGTTAQPESSRSSATYNNPDITTRDASREGQGTVCNCPDCNCYTFVVVIVLGAIIFILLVRARSCLCEDYSTLKKKINKIICRKDSSKIDASVQTEEETRIAIPGNGERPLDEERRPLLERHEAGNVPADGLNRDEGASSLPRLRRLVSEEGSQFQIQ